MSSTSLNLFVDGVPNFTVSCVVNPVLDYLTKNNLLTRPVASDEIVKEVLKVPVTASVNAGNGSIPQSPVNTGKPPYGVVSAAPKTTRMKSTPGGPLCNREIGKGERTGEPCGKNAIPNTNPPRCRLCKDRGEKKSTTSAAAKKGPPSPSSSSINDDEVALTRVPGLDERIGRELHKNIAVIIAGDESIAFGVFTDDNKSIRPLDIEEKAYCEKLGLLTGTLKNTLSAATLSDAGSFISTFSKN